MDVLSILPDVQIVSDVNEPSDDLTPYGLNMIHCSICNDKGRILRRDADGIIRARECKCMSMRRSLRRIERSGLSDALKRYSFEAYQTPDDQREALLNAAKTFCESDSGWFYIAGQSGSGKSHICTAICGELLKKTDVRYMLWRDEAVKIKASVTDNAEYTELIAPLKTVPVLYIDDFLKGKVTDADLNLAFELINARYNDSRKRTIISSELSMRRLLQLDEAMGGRIYERAKGYCFEAPEENWRLRA